MCRDQDRDQALATLILIITLVYRIFGDLMFEVVLGVFEDADSENGVSFGVYGLV